MSPSSPSGSRPVTLPRHLRVRQRRLLVGSLSVLLLGLGCRFQSVAPLKEMSKTLDHAQETLEAYGTATLSSPLLSLPTEKAPSSFNLERSATQYFDEAKRDVQGRSALFEQVVQSLGVSASGQY